MAPGARATVVVSRLLSRPSTLAGIVSVDLVARTLDGIAVPASISLLRQSLPFGAVGWLAGWTLFYVVVFRAAPLVFPTAVREWSERDGFRHLTALATVLFGVYVAGAFTASFFPSALVYPVPFRPSPVTLYGVPVLAALAFVGYLAADDPARLGRDSGFVLQFFDAATRFSDITDSDEGANEGLDTETWPGRILLVLVTLLVLAGVLGVVFFLGLFAQVLSYLYPLPELLALGYVGLSVAAPAYADGRTSDLERRLVTGTAVVSWGPKGAAACLLVFAGLFASTVGFLFATIVVAGVTRALADPTVPLDWSAFEWVTATTVVVWLGTYGLYGTWYWVRTLDRLPAFLDAWESRRGVDVASEWTWPWESDPEVARPIAPARPPDLLLVPTTLALGGALVITVFGATTPVTIAGLLLLAAGCLAAAAVARDWPPQPATTEQYALPAALLIQLSGVGVTLDLMGGWGLTTFVTTGDLSGLPGVLEWLLLGALVVCLPFYVHDWFLSWTTSEDLRAEAALAAVGLLMGGLSVLSERGRFGLLSVVAFLTVAAGSAVLKRLERF